MKTWQLLGLLAAMLLMACSNGGGSSAPALPPLSENIMSQYGGQKFTYTSPDGTCMSNLALYDDDNSQMTVQDNGPCPVLFKETFALNCTGDRHCTGRLAKYSANVTVSLDSPTSVTATVRNDVEQVDHTITYTLVQ